MRLLTHAEIALGRLGAEVAGFELERPDFPALRRALIEHHLLLFRGRTLEPEEQVRFTLGFGECLHTAAPALRYLPDHPAIFRVANRQGIGNLNNGCYWHCDGHYLRSPTAISVHHIIEAPPESVTLYVDLAKAWDEMPEPDRRLAEMLQTRSQTCILRSLVIGHPVTGRRGLYVNFDRNAAIVDVVGHRMREFEDEMRRHLHRLAYGHRWRQGDLVLVDNFAIAHHAVASDPRHLRILHRTTIGSQFVWWH